MSPKRVTAIVIAQIANAFNDYPDWLGQLLVETPLDEPHKHDCVHWARKSARQSVTLAPSNNTKLNSERVPKPNSAYLWLHTSDLIWV